MADHVVVVLGAGASHAATYTPPLREDWRPPLAKDLFAPRFAGHLAYYPLVQSVAPDIRVRSGAVGLEAFLRDQLRDSPHEYDRRRYRIVPLYLQHLLFDASRIFTELPDNYDRLVNAAMRHEEAIFVTLNYDTILDQRLSIRAKIDAIDAYIGNEGWSLIKLHGSVNWRRQVLDAEELPGDTWLDQTIDALGDDIQLSDVITVSGDTQDVRAVRRDGGGFHFPVLSVPLGAQDELSCPADQVSFLSERLAALESLNVVVVGYSGLDDAVIDVFRGSGSQLRSLLVIDQNADLALKTAERFTNATGSDLHEEMAFNGDFNAFAQTDALTDHFAALP